MLERAVVNASPIIVLTRSGHGDLLKSVLGDICVPRPVVDEIARRGTSDVSFQFLQNTNWVEIVAPPPPPKSILEWNLGQGESAVLAHALLSKHSCVVLDDLAGRKCATAHGLTVRGTVGIIVYAKQLELIASAESVLKDILACGFRLSHHVLEGALQRAGERP